MEQNPYKLLLTSIECIKHSGENSKDNIYLKVYIDGKYYDTYFQGSTCRSTYRRWQLVWVLFHVLVSPSEATYAADRDGGQRRKTG